ncbi:MAG: heme-binding protein [Ramlibacter sp.]|nr:heme-binding protein [Ramlibacter sp.]
MNTTTTHGVRTWVAGAAIAAAALLGHSAMAQQATLALRSITPDAALKAARAALASCQKSGYQVAVAVTDRGGQPIVMLRDRFAGPHTPNTAQGKAWTALTFKIDTLAFAQLTQAGQPMSGIRELPGVVAIGGGRMIESAGSIVGAIGVSGAPGGEADDACVKAGIAAIADELEL